MKKSKTVAAAAAALLSLGITGVATASAASAQTNTEPVIYGSDWTIYGYSNGFCENIVFYARTFVAVDLYGDAGRFSGGVHTLAFHWTRGLDTGNYFNGVYNRAGHGYYGYFDSSSSLPASVTKGWTSGC
jgi:hypothetical protein